MPLVQVFAGNVRAVRTRAGLSQDALGKLAGLSTNYVSMLERGQRAPSFEVLEQLAKTLNVEPWRLLK